jgi:serine/threonine protein kinase/Tfp pilus assembly protein PilF
MALPGAERGRKLMKAERWKKVNDLFQSAVERAPGDRATFLDEACHGDEGLRREVGSLLTSYERSENFIELPAYEVAPELVTNDSPGALVGTLIGHYRIESLIGVGGMGEVYLAQDERLGRKAALKLLPDSLTADKAQLSRFKNEARSASALNHPNILTVYEIGAEGNRQFIATEFIEGVTLRASIARGRMNPHEALEIAIQVASALAAAHQAGVVHRDIKPENIMLRPDGYVKVLDFGIAKLTEQTPGSADHTVETTALLQTRPGLVLGTAHYMSPEQARGQKVDARTDIWSLGVVLYEIVGGSPPFHGETPSDCIAAILTTDPPPLAGVLPAVPLKLESILQKALRKKNDERYQTIKEMLADLRVLKGKLEVESSSSRTKALGETIISKIKRHKRGVFLTLAAALLVAAAVAYSFFFVAPVSLPNEKSIAVLPFENLSEEKSNAYFADGIQDEILTRLSKIADLKVISRTSTQRYKNTSEKLSQIANQLGVANLLEGSVQKTNDQVRVTVQLIRAANDSHLWAETFDRKLTDIFSVESEVAKAIADQLRAKLTGQEEELIAAQPTDNPEAYDAYLRGLAFEGRNIAANYTTDLAGNAIGFYERAVQLDPNFAIAWARLSRVDAHLYFNRDDTATAARGDAAKRALESAQKLEPNSPETLLALGYYQYLVLRDYGSAKTTFSRVSKMLPGSSEVPEALGTIARREGHWDQSIAYFERALTLNPRDVKLLMDAAWTYAMLRQFPPALKLYDRVLDITPNDPDAMALKAGIYQAKGNLPEAARLLSGINEQTPNDETFFIKINQLRLEHNYGEAVRLLEARLAEFHFASQYTKGYEQVALALTRRLAGDKAGAEVTAKQARNTLEQLYRDQPDNVILAARVSQAFAATGEKDSALKLAERAIMLQPRAIDRVSGPTFEENLALIQTSLGEKSRAISTLTQLLQTPYNSWIYAPAPITPAFLKLDPIWESLRADPAFQRLCEEKQP